MREGVRVKLALQIMHQIDSALRASTEQHAFGRLHYVDPARRIAERHLDGRPLTDRGGNPQSPTHITFPLTLKGPPQVNGLTHCAHHLEHGQVCHRGANPRSARCEGGLRFSRVLSAAEGHHHLEAG